MPDKVQVTITMRDVEDIDEQEIYNHFLMAADNLPDHAIGVVNGDIEVDVAVLID